MGQPDRKKRRYRWWIAIGAGVGLCVAGFVLRPASAPVAEPVATVCQKPAPASMLPVSDITKKMSERTYDIRDK
jgi:hypothetical protein